MANIVWMENIGMDDVPLVGGKNASLGEMIKAVSPKGVRVPSGFVVTTDAYNYFMEKTGMDTFVQETLKDLDVTNLRDLAKRGLIVRNAISRATMPKDLAMEIVKAYEEMEHRYGKNVDVAVRSSATAEDLPGASFAGEHETYLGIRGANDVIKATQRAMASLFTDRAISYRKDKGFEGKKVALSVGVQKMVRSDKASSGVMFTVDTDTGFRNMVLINATWGLGELIVQGHVTPDEYQVFKPTIKTASNPIINKVPGDKLKKMVYATGFGRGIHRLKTVSTTKAEQNSFILTDEEIIQLAQWGMIIEEHYSARAGKWTPMDMEWAKDGQSGELYIVQARPETIQGVRDFMKIKEYSLLEHGEEVVRGISVGSSIATGKAHIVMSPKQITEFKKGEILVTTMTDPDWEPIMRMASAIITDKGGRTSHAAIVSRELGVPAIVGTGNATRKIKTGSDLTVSTIGSDGIAYAGIAKFEVKEHDVTQLPTPKTKIYVNVGSPGIAAQTSFLPAVGVGLAREEFIIASQIAVHPLALLTFDKLAPALRSAITKKMNCWNDPVQFYVDRLAFGIAQIGAAFHPRPVIVRFSDFKSNEYATLLGGDLYEPDEENPMIGWRGASRYYDPKFAAAFELECQAIKRVREDMGVDNVIPMIPFCRTLDEGRHVLEIMAKNGLVAASMARDGQKTTPVYMMCEIPSNVLLADEFLDLFDGMSIGSNDLTQLTLGLDRDGGMLSHIGNENNAAVKKLIEAVIHTCRRRGKYIGICGQGPSDFPDFAAFLVEKGIESMSLNPDVVVKTIINIAEVEKNVR